MVLTGSTGIERSLLIGTDYFQTMENATVKTTHWFSCCTSSTRQIMQKCHPLSPWAELFNILDWTAFRYWQNLENACHTNQKLNNTRHSKDITGKNACISPFCRTKGAEAGFLLLHYQQNTVLNFKHCTYLNAQCTFKGTGKDLILAQWQARWNNPFLKTKVSLRHWQTENTSFCKWNKPWSN